MVDLKFIGTNNPLCNRNIWAIHLILKEQDAIVVRLGHKRNTHKIKHYPSEIYTYLKAAIRILNMEKQKHSPTMNW